MALQPAESEAGRVEWVGRVGIKSFADLSSGLCPTTHVHASAKTIIDVLAVGTGVELLIYESCRPYSRAR